jgi:hypothetical protein
LPIPVFAVAFTSMAMQGAPWEFLAFGVPWICGLLAFQYSMVGPAMLNWSNGVLLAFLARVIEGKVEGDPLTSVRGSPNS